MDKIVFITEETNTNENLLKCLNLLFPECEIQVQQKKPLGTHDSHDIQTRNKETEDRENKYLSFL